MIPLLLRFWKPSAGALAALLLVWFIHHRGYVAGQAQVQVAWDKDTAARATAAARDIADAREKESAARAANEVIVNEYSKKLVAIAGERDSYYGMLRQARGSVLACRADQATDSLVAATAGEASVAERIDRATANAIAEARSNAEQLDALIAVVKPQL